MADQFESSCIYVDFDSLFDTRLATIHQFGLDAVEEVLKGDYFDRIADEFNGLDQEKYNEAYKNRNVTILKNAMVTPVASIIQKFAHRTLEALVSTPFRRQPKLLFNIHPYKIPEEGIQSILMGIRAITRNTIDIEIIDMTPEEVTPAYMKKNIVTAVIYDYVKWLDIHSANKNFVTTQCPQVMLIAPCLLKSNDVLRQVKLDDAIDAIEKHASLFIRLMLYPIDVFCIDMARFKANFQKTT